MIDTLTVLERIRKAAAVESKMGFKNAAVFGGFSAFVIKTLSQLPREGQAGLAAGIGAQVKRVIRRMAKYVEGRPADRQVLVREVLTLLAHLEKDRLADKVAPRSKAASKAVKEKPKAGVKTAKKDEGHGAPASELQFLKSVGPKRAAMLNRLGISTVAELLYHFPRRYEDRSNLKKFLQLADGEVETVIGTVVGCQDMRPRRGLTITKAAIHDGQSVGYAVWFNQAYVKKQIPNGTEILVTGKVDRKYGAVQIAVTDYETSDHDEPVHSGRIVPIYPATEGLQPRVLRSIMKLAADRYIPLQQEFLPDAILTKYRFPQLNEALGAMHFPGSMEDVTAATRRLVFEELFLLQIGVGLLKANETAEHGIRHKMNGPLVREFTDKVPFALTGAQERVLGEIFRDMEDEKPMNRLVQGDVGSGKTVVAAAALVKTVENGYQGAMMAPTEILAAQHYEGLSELLNPLGIQTALLTGSVTKSEKIRIQDDIKEGRIDIVIGTHAVIQDDVEFQRLGLAITDEQHRFGVKQRAQLKKKGSNPDILVMTATPIPRTLALTVYGDLDVSVIDELPPGRQAIKTHWISSRMKEKAYSFIRQQVAEGRQVYYVCPLVEESEKLDVQAAVELAQHLQNQVFPGMKIGLMHGRLKQADKDRVMADFKSGSLNIMVATTVVEVGVNVPNATVMVVEDADRFGLSQLHQLRGRVGRGSHQSHCILIANPGTEEGQARMKIMQATCDGFVIAEEDLKLRGPGEFFGTRQSGIPDLKIADIIRDIKILQVAREEAFALLENDPGLKMPEHAALRSKVLEKFRGTDNYIKIS